ncbi:MAG: RluA family pseudouridine synthase [Oscillospiraceae bacterium]|nr:RluA family pseudouridine synthase [Oscillospiraceae bacterium]
MKNTKEDIVFEVKEDGGLLSCVRKERPELPSGKAKSYLEHRMISVDGTITSKFDYPVKQGQTIKISQAVNSSYDSPLEVIYEDSDLLAINKPAGLLSVATDTEKENTAIRLLRESGIDPLYVVHRIDRDTSGVLLFSKSIEIRDKLQASWEEIIRREYLAVCEGVFAEKRGRCDTILRETSTHLVYSVKSGEGQRAITNYEVIKENAHYSYLRVLIETGRKNQIRVHMKELSHPVVGDKKYGAHGNPMGRLGLHASLLEFIHPRTENPVVIKAPTESRFRLPKEKK